MSAGLSGLVSSFYCGLFSSLNCISLHGGISKKVMGFVHGVYFPCLLLCLFYMCLDLFLVVFRLFVNLFMAVLRRGMYGIVVYGTLGWFCKAMGDKDEVD